MKTTHSPFKFLDAFTFADRDAFFGRDKEIAQLYALVFKTPLLLIYGASGTGKTSLIQCGLANTLDGTDWLPLHIRRNIDVNHSMDLALNEYLPNPQNTEGSLKENIEALYQHYLRPVFLIFDQFEELFIFGTKSERDLFIDRIKMILDNDLPCNILIVIREEYLGQLYPLEKEIPELFNFRMRVEPMDTIHVKKVLTQSFAKFNISVESPVDERLGDIVDNVSHGKSGIELPYLQVYLDKLYKETFERLYPNQTNPKEEWLPLSLKEKDIKDFGTIDNVLDKFLIEQQEEIQNQLSEKDPSVKRDIVRQILDAFVSDEGTKRPIRYKRENDSIKLETSEQRFFPTVTPFILNFCLTAMESARLIRSDNNNMELAHDSLAALIDKRRTDEQRERNDIKRQIRSIFQNFQRTNEYLTQKQIAVSEDVLSELNLEAELIQFFNESKAARLNDAAIELKKEKERNEQLQKALEEADELRAVAEGNYNRAEVFSLQADNQRIRAVNNWHIAKYFLMMAFVGLFVATWFYFDAREQKNVAIKEKNKAEKSYNDLLKAQEDKEIAEFQGVLQGAIDVLSNDNTTNCLEPWRIRAIDSMKTKYPKALELQEKIKIINVKRQQKKCD
jgi:RNase P protein component